MKFVVLLFCCTLAASGLSLEDELDEEWSIFTKCFWEAVGKSILCYGFCFNTDCFTSCYEIYKESLRNCKCSWCEGAGMEKFPLAKPPTINGCGGGFLAEILNPVMTNKTIECCNAHDICYGTCNKSKTECEVQFESCLSNLCKNFKEEGICIKGIITSSVKNFGCPFYKEAQEESCGCRQRN